ncbi:hypothetical protein PCANB_002700 [Pneumocystis canis]|nr:hypothetical protein PCANB_002700 [Pneumocystis canis]
MIEDQAIHAFKTEMYNEALELFTKALQQNKTLSLLDGRAATFEKLGEYEYALKDSYKMIRSYPYNAEGYLRAGKVLRLMDKHIKAIDIYKRGIKYSHRGSKKSDTISLCQRVSKNWRHMILSMDSLFYNLDFSCAKKLVPSKIILMNIKRSRNFVQSVILNRKCVISDSALLYMANFCCNLTHLTLSKGFDLELFSHSVSAFSSLLSLIFLYETELSVVAKVMSNAPNSLRKLEAKRLLINFIPLWGQKVTYIKIIKLTRVDVSLCNNRVIFFDVSNMLKITPNVTHIFLNNWVENLILDTYSFLYLDNLTILDLSGSKFSRIPLMPKCLLQLNLSHLFGIDITLSEIPNFECLWRLNLSYSPGLYSNIVIALSKSSGCNLKELILDYCPRIDKHCIIDIVISCKFIEKLSLSGNSWVDDSLLEVIAQELKGLKDVNLSNCYSISGFGVIELVKKLSLIMHIGLNGCHNVSLDSVMWMRQLGIEIDYMFEMGSSNKLYGF